MRLYGVCNHTVNQVAALFPKHRLSVVTDVAALEKRKLLVFLDAAQVTSNLARLNRVRGTGVLFSGPLRLAALRGARLLDLTCEHTPPFYGVKIRSDLDFSALESAVDEPLSVAPIDYTSAIIEHVESTSILTDFMTIIYSLPSSTHQKPVKTVLLHWLHQGGTVVQLDRLLLRISETLTLSVRNIERIRALLLSPIGLRVQQALASKLPVTQAAVEFSVSAYDMRYIASIVKEGPASDLERALVKF